MACSIPSMHSIVARSLLLKGAMIGEMRCSVTLAGPARLRSIRSARAAWRVVCNIAAQGLPCEPHTGCLARPDK